MARYQYKNISNQKQILVGVGEVEPNAIIDTDIEIHNVHFVKIEAGKRFTGVDPVTEIKDKK